MKNKLKYCLDSTYGFLEGFMSFNLFGGSIYFNRKKTCRSRTPGEYLIDVGKYFPRLPEPDKEKTK